MGELEDLFFLHRIFKIMQILGESFLQWNNYFENNCLYLVTVSECQNFLTLKLFVIWKRKPQNIICKYIL